MSETPYQRLLLGSSSKVKRSDVICDDKVCFVDYEIVADCYVYLHSNDTNCDIPCKLSGCQKELHHFISCPIWTCNAFTTTSTSKSTSTTTTTTTDLTTTSRPDSTTTFPFPTFDHPGYLYSSVVLNVLLFLCIIYMLLKKCKKAICRRIQNFRQNREGYQNVRDDSGARRSPIVRNSRRSQHQGLPNVPNLDTIFVLDDLESQISSENSPLLRRADHAVSPRVPSFLNTPTDSFADHPLRQCSTSTFVGSLGQTQTNRVPIKLNQPPTGKGFFRTRSNPPSMDTSCETQL